MGIESPKFEPPKEKSDLTTSEGRQKEIERIMTEEGKEKPKEKSREEIPETKEAKKEKSPETPQFDLDKTRDDYAKAHNEYRKEFGGMKGEKMEAFEKTIESAREKFIKPGDSEKIIEVLERIKPSNDASERRIGFIDELEKRGIGIDKAAAIYETELKKAEYEAAKVEAGKKLSEQGVGKAEIFKQLILNERELLNQAKIENWPPKEKNIFRKGMEWYMKRGTATRLLISTGLVTGVVASVGGFGAAAVATYAGYRFVRGFGSVMIAKLAGKGVDMAMSRGIESKKEAAMEKLKTGLDLEKLKETEKELEKIFEETAKRERRKLLIKAAVSVTAGAGAAIGMGMLEHAWAGGGGVKVAPETLKSKTPAPETLKPSEVSPEVPTETPLKPGMPFSPEETRSRIADEAVPKAVAGISPENIVEVQKGDSVWRLAERQLETRDYFKGLTGSPEEILAKKRYFIDAIKDKVAENPAKFGITSGNAELIKPGEKIDFSSIFEDKEGKIDLIRHSYRAEGLSEEEIRSILGAGKPSPESVLQPEEQIKTVSEMTPEEKTQEIAKIRENLTGKTKITGEESWAEAGKKVEYVDKEVSKIPENYYTRPDEAAKIIAEQAIKDPVFFEKIGNIMGDSYFRYENFRNFKIGLLLDKQGPQWRAIEEHFGEIKGLKPEEYLAIDSGTKNLLERTNNVFENIANPIEKDAARNLTLDQFLRKYFKKL